MLTKEEWLQALADREGWARLRKFQQGSVLICGLGGLGSRVAELLTRAGVGHLRLVDFDVLEATNLNRQLYGMEQLGQYKAKALKENLCWITPYMNLEVRVDKVTEDNLPDLVRDMDVVVEAFDNPAAKALLVNFVRERYPALPLVAASGMAGSCRKIFTCAGIGSRAWTKATACTAPGWHYAHPSRHWWCCRF